MKKVVLPEEQTDYVPSTTEGDIVFEETSIPAIIEEEEFGMKLDETTEGKTTEMDDVEDATEEESIQDSSVVFPLPQNPETTTTMLMTDDMAATIGVDEDELNPITEETESPNLEETTSAANEIMGEPATTEDVLKARIDDIPSITTSDDIETTTIDATQKMTDSAPESEMDPTTMTNVVLETDEKATIAEVETVNTEDAESTTPTGDIDVKDIDTTTSLPTTEGDAVEPKEELITDLVDTETTTKTLDDADSLVPSEEADTTTVSQDVTTASSLPSEVDAISEETIETTTKVEEEKTVDTDEDISTTMSSVTEPKIGINETTPKMKESRK